MDISAISKNRDLWVEEYRYEVAERDKLSNIEASEEIGFKRGLEKGLLQGLQLKEEKSL